MTLDSFEQLLKSYYVSGTILDAGVGKQISVLSQGKRKTNINTLTIEVTVINVYMYPRF